MKPEGIVSMKDVQPLLQKVIYRPKKKKYSASAISKARQRA